MNLLKLNLIFLLFTVIAWGGNPKDSVLLFHLDPSINSIKILEEENELVDYESLNIFLKNNGVNKIEKWNKYATDIDVYNGIHFSKIYRIYFSDKSKLMEIKQKLESLNEINVVEFEYDRKTYYTPNDPRYNNQWFLTEINSNDAWDLWDIDNNQLPGDRDIILSSVDLGVNWQHQDLAPNLWQNLGEDADGDGRTIEYINGQWVFDPDDLNGIDDDNWDNNLSTFIDDLVGWDVSGSTYGDNDPDVPNNGGWAHGTHVAGLLSATTNNNIGIASTAFNCSIMSVKCTNENDDPSYINNGFEGVLYAAKAGFHSQGFSIVNLSWGGVGYNVFEQEMMNLCAEEYNALIFAAAGNDNIEQAHYPSSYENVISVTASGQNNSWNHWATYHYTVDLASPGESIQSCVNNGSGYSSWNGTSMASPVAASVAGLMKSLNPSWTVEQISTMIKATADPIIYELNTEEYIQGKLGTGRVDALKAVTTSLFPKITLEGSDIITNNTNNEIYAGDTIELIAIFSNNPNWGAAINPEINLNCYAENISIINNTISLENIPPGEATINFEPLIVEFDSNMESGLYECDLNFYSNHDDYVKYVETFPIELEIQDVQILFGDLNEDQVVDILDVILCVNIVIETAEPTNYQILASDMNQDQQINVQDIILMISLILN